MFHETPYLICIVGPTAVGKTNLSIKIAEKLDSDIISCDSRQFYSELDIGTAKPTPEELEKVPHHFINNLSINEEYTVMDFESEAIKKISELHGTKRVVVMVGGSGLFYKAVVDGFDEIPNVDPSIRKELVLELNKFGIENLQNELKSKDLDLYNAMDIENPQRLIRALEICRGTGKPYSGFRKGKGKNRPFNIIKIGLEMDREELYKRIDSRMDEMLKAGLVDEVKSLVTYKEKNALQTVGYKEIFDYLEGKYDWNECERLLKRNSRRYAKRQTTWFKKDEDIHWIKVDSLNLKTTENSIWKLLESYSISTIQD